MNAAAASVRNAVIGSPVEELVPSQALVDMLKRRERLKLTRYRLQGERGWTIGYGHYTPDTLGGGPESITADEAERIFRVDLDERGARWVRAYVVVPLEQHQYDALVHMAFNLSPKAFRTIAQAVNAGLDPEQAALAYVREGSTLEAGLRARRAQEINLYRSGVYA